MTALGKILVFIVLLLALVWNALVVNAYVTRVNWKTELENSKKKLVVAADAANAERVRADRSREAAEAVISQLNEEIARLKGSETTLVANLADAKKKLAEGQLVESNTQVRDLQAIANKEKTQKQVDILKAELDASEKAKNDALIAAQKAKNDAVQANIDAESARRRADELEARVLKLNDPNRGSGGVGAIRPQVDKDFRAKITSVEGDSVVINLGTNAGLKKGVVLQVSRYKPEAKFVGNLTITSVDPFYAVGRFSAPANVAKPTAADMPKIDDTVSVIE